MHPLGLPDGPEGTTCATCVWGRHGHCQMLAAEGEDQRGPDVGATTPACGHHAEALDCLACGACCREAYDSVPVTPDDAVNEVHPELLRVDGDWVDLKRVPSPTGCGSRCVALVGEGPYHCRIYAVRPQTCRDVETGEPGCLFARRRVGLSPDPRERHAEATGRQP